MILGTFVKQPIEVLDYDIDASDWILSSDFIASATVTVEPTGLTVQSTLIASPRVKIWLYGGVNGTTYKATVNITTDDGRVKQVEFRLRVKDQ